jgi:Icc-related predicted phosphoesterase
VRVAVAGDIHCREQLRDQITTAFAQLPGSAELVLLAGDLTTHGDPEEGAVLADACRDLGLPVFAVLGNHDWHVDRVRELIAVLEDGGVTVLERSHAICCIDGIEIGIAGTKGFVGGFTGSRLPDFGEPLLRRVYAETTAEVEALDAALRAIAHCPVRIVLLHYAPIEATLEGESPGIFTMLGSDRLAGPIAEHEPDLVVHGHAHDGKFRGAVGGVPVYNVSVHVIGRDFWTFELTDLERAATPLH